MPLPILTLQNLLTYNSTLFDDIALPDGVSKQLLLDTIVRSYGDMAPICLDWPALRYYNQSWFASHLPQLQHLWNDYMAEYNPIYNKDGYIEESRTPQLEYEEKHTDTQSGAGSSSESGSTVQQYKGFQASAFNDVGKTIPGTSVSNTASSTASGTSRRSERGREDIFRHEYGNIGVTMASQMLRDDSAFWQTFSFYDIAAKLWAVDNLVMIY